MRYFKTSNASRPYKAGGFAFDFESLYLVGGSWLGTLEVRTDEQADILAEIPQATEIEEEEYLALKKKAQNEPISYRRWRSRSVATLPNAQALQSPPKSPAEPVEKVELSIEDREIMTSAVDVEDPLAKEDKKAKEG